MGNAGVAAPREVPAEATAEIEDLRAKLANTMKAHDALVAQVARTKERAATRTDVFRAKVDELKDALEGAEDARRCADQELEQEQKDHTETAAALRDQDEMIRSLVGVRRMLKSGEARKALDELDHVLNRTDTCWSLLAA